MALAILAALKGLFGLTLHVPVCKSEKLYSRYNHKGTIQQGGWIGWVYKQIICYFHPDTA